MEITTYHYRSACSPFSALIFFFMYFEALLLGTYTFRIIMHCCELTDLCPSKILRLKSPMGWNLEMRHLRGD